MAEFGQDVFRADLDSLYYATAKRSARKAAGRKMAFGDRRRAIKVARAMSRRGIKRRQDLNRAIVRSGRAAGALAAPGWAGQRSLAGSRSGAGSSATTGICVTNWRQSPSVPGWRTWSDAPPEDVQRQLEELEADRGTLFRMPRLTELTERFEATGLAASLDETVDTRRGCRTCCGDSAICLVAVPDRPIQGVVAGAP